MYTFFMATTGMVKGHNASGVLGRLAAGLTASDDINKAQSFQASNDNKQAIHHYEKVTCFY